MSFVVGLLVLLLIISGIIISRLIQYYRQVYLKGWLKRNGVLVLAQVVDLQKQNHVRKDGYGRLLWNLVPVSVITVQWQQPQTHHAYTFTQRIVGRLAKTLIPGQPIVLLVDPNNPRRYSMVIPSHVFDVSPS
jgi:hypothetical protein